MWFVTSWLACGGTFVPIDDGRWSAEAYLDRLERQVDAETRETHAAARAPELLDAVLVLDGDTATLTAGKIAHFGIPGDIGDKSGENIANLGITCPNMFFNAADNGFSHSEIGINLIGLVEHAERDAAAEEQHARGFGEVGVESVLRFVGDGGV